MRKLFALGLASALLGLLILLPGCSDDDDGPTGTEKTEFEVLTEYMAANNLDLPDFLSGWIVTAQTITDDGLDDYFIIDIRDADDYDDGHIPGALNTTLGNVVAFEEANNTLNKPIVVACYTGQTAGHAVMALRSNGEAAQVLKWGMASWHTDFAAKWTDNTDDAADAYTGSWSTDAPPAFDSFDDPDVATGKSEGGAIFQDQLTNRVLDDFNKISIATVLDNYDDYQIINFWGRSAWDRLGHITDAYQIAPDSLTLDNLDVLDPDKDIVVYCWSGQTGSIVAAWLNVLGYDAYDLTFAANGMIYSDLESTDPKWNTDIPADYDYDTSATEFEILVEYMTEQSLDLPTLLDGWIVTAQTISDNGLDEYFIMDIRVAGDYDEGHIPGALNTLLSDAVTFEAANNTSNDPVVVVCYTGQSAGHAVMALRLLGKEAQVLKWGMCSWHSDFAGKWNSNTGDAADAYTGSWSTDAPPELDSFADPVLDTGLGDGAAILAHQIDTRVLDEFNAQSIATVLDDYDDYHLINYWTRDAWDRLGHITTSYLAEPGDLHLESLDMMDPDGDNVIWCWTGQTASMIAAWLNVLGYDAYDLTFGANGMIHTELEETDPKWNSTIPADFDYETGGGISS
jgi:rhodanese-related sulfurtransferase